MTSIICNWQNHKDSFKRVSPQNDIDIICMCYNDLQECLLTPAHLQECLLTYDFMLPDILVMYIREKMVMVALQCN